jgi:hypothetical protein
MSSIEVDFYSSIAPILQQIDHLIQLDDHASFWLVLMDDALSHTLTPV